MSKPRMSNRERVLYEAGYQKNTRAAGTLLNQLMMVDVYGEAKHATCGHRKVTGEELLAKARDIGGHEVKTYIEKHVPLCTPRCGDRPLGLGTAPILLVGWIHGREHPELFEKFCLGIRNQRCQLTTFLRSRIDETKKTKRSTLTPQELFDHVLIAWTQYCRERVES